MMYYMEVNLTCIIILLLFKYLSPEKRNTLSSEKRIMNAMISLLCTYCVSDIVARIVRGTFWNFSRVLIEISNLVCFETLIILSFLWSLYVYVRLKRPNKYNKIDLLLWALPLLLFTIIALSNPYVHFLFTINEQNLYQRNNGIYLHWIILWMYFLSPTLIAFRLWLKENNKIRKNEIAPLLLFSIAPAIASIIQMLFYGVTTTQVGIMISIIMILMASQNSLVLTDSLTGINNRRGFDLNLSNVLQSHRDYNYLFIMIDIDNFKRLNDQYGHLTGDIVLKVVANVIKNSCKEIPTRLFYCRYGGDEFVIFGKCNDENIIVLLKEKLNKELNKQIKENTLPNHISMSIGGAIGKCNSELEFTKLLNSADEKMYLEKEERHISK